MWKNTYEKFKIKGMECLCIGVFFLCVFLGNEKLIFAKTVKADISGNQVKIGKQIQIEAKTKNVRFKSSDTAIAAVSKSGIVTGKKEGNVTIKVKRSGYKTKKFTVKVKKNNRKPDSLGVALEEVSIQSARIEKDKKGDLKYEAVIKNNATTGKIKKIQYFYHIQEIVEEKIIQKENQNTNQTTNETTNQDENQNTNQSEKQNVNQEETTDQKKEETANQTDKKDNAENNKVKYIYVKKTVVLTAKNIKAGKKSKIVTCQADVSGKIRNMKLTKVKLYTGKALYEYDAVKQKGTLKWGTPDKTAPVFSGQIGKNSYWNDTPLMVCYSDKQNSYHYMKNVKAVDDRDGKVKISVDTSKINWRKTGVYKVKYTAKDKAGNKAKAWAKVKVYVKGTAESAADNILNSITKSNWSDIEKAKAIYKYVKKHMSYINSATHGDWREEGVNGIRYGSGDCYTYMAISRLLLTRAGIPCITVKYESNTNRHFWVLAYVNGGWYHFDTTPRLNRKEFCLLTDWQARANGQYPITSSNYPARATKVIH